MTTAASALSQHRSQKQAIKLYKNRYQWQVKDMRKAGINPILASAAASPGTAQTIQPWQAQRMQGAGSLLEESLAGRSTRAKKGHEASLAAIETVLRDTAVTNARQQTQILRAQGREAAAKATIAESMTHSARAIGAWDASEAGRRAAVFNRMMERGVPAAKAIGWGFGALKAFGLGAKATTKLLQTQKRRGITNYIYGSP